MYLDSQTARANCKGIPACAERVFKKKNNKIK